MLQFFVPATLFPVTYVCKTLLPASTPWANQHCDFTMDSGVVVKKVPRMCNNSNRKVFYSFFVNHGNLMHGNWEAFWVAGGINLTVQYSAFKLCVLFWRIVIAVIEQLNKIQSTYCILKLHYHFDFSNCLLCIWEFGEG